jgi:hypothetical protein
LSSPRYGRDGDHDRDTPPDEPGGHNERSDESRKAEDEEDIEDTAPDGVTQGNPTLTCEGRVAAHG